MAVNLADSLQSQVFLSKLGELERIEHHLSDWEKTFITGLRDSFDNRESMLDMGITPWNPSRNQWNTLGEIHRKYL